MKTGARNDEKRLHPRFDVDVDLLISTGIRRIKGRIVDVSVGGALIMWEDTLQRIDDAISTGHFVDVEVDRKVAIQGYVVRTTEEHIGVRFDIADDELPATIRQMSDLTGCDLVAA